MNPCSELLLFRILVLLTICALPRLSVGEGEPSTNWQVVEDAFNGIQDVEKNLPEPQLEETIVFGTIDCTRYSSSTGVEMQRIARSFRQGSLVGRVACIPRQGCSVEPSPDIRVFAKTLHLQFKVIGTCARYEFPDFTPTIPTPGTYELRIESSTMNPSFIRWSAVTFNGSLESWVTVELTRYPVGAGVFTLNVVPTGLVYAPVQGAQHSNFIKLTQTDWVGIRASTSFTTTESVTTPDSIPPYSLDNMSSLASVASSLSSKISSISAASPYLAGVSSALNTIQSAIGTVKNSTSSEEMVNNAHELEVRHGVSNIVQNGPDGAPFPLGDLVYWLSNVKFAWVSDGEVLHTTLSGYQIRNHASILALRNHLALLADKPALPECSTKWGAFDCTNHDVFGLNAEDTAMLLSLDRFAFKTFFPFGPNHFKNDDRFTIASPFGSPTGNEGLGRVYSDEVLTTNIRSVQHTDTQIRDEKPGFLSVLGIGPSEEKTIYFSMTAGNLKAQTLGSRTEQEIMVFRGTPPFKVCLDRIFGSYLMYPIVDLRDSNSNPR